MGNYTSLLSCCTKTQISISEVNSHTFMCKLVHNVPKCDELLSATHLTILFDHRKKKYEDMKKVQFQKSEALSLLQDINEYDVMIFHSLGCEKNEQVAEICIEARRVCLNLVKDKLAIQLHWYERLLEKPNFIPMRTTISIKPKENPKKIEEEDAMPLLEFPSTPIDDLKPDTRDDKNDNNKGDSGGNTKVPAQLF